MCPGCKYFFETQLYPTFYKFKGNNNVNHKPDLITDFNFLYKAKNILFDHIFKMYTNQNRYNLDVFTRENS